MPFLRCAARRRSSQCPPFVECIVHILSLGTLVMHENQVLIGSVKDGICDTVATVPKHPAVKPVRLADMCANRSNSFRASSRVAGSPFQQIENFPRKCG